MKAEDDEENGNSVKVEVTSITPVLHAFLDFLHIRKYGSALYIGIAMVILPCCCCCFSS